MTQEELNEARVLHMTAHALLPLLEEKHEHAYDRLLGAFRSGSTENLALLAECNAYRSLIEEVNYKLAALGNIEET